MASTYFFFVAFVEFKFYFFLTYGNAGRLIPILFWVWIRLQNIFLGVLKSCGTHLKRVAGQDFFVQFWIMSFQQYFSHIFFFFFFFFFQVLSAKLWHSPQVSCWTRFLFPKFCWPSCGTYLKWGERGGSVVECRTPEREVRGSRPTAAVLCPWARHFTPRKYWLITQEAMAPSLYDWKIVDWDVKPQHNQPTNLPQMSCWPRFFSQVLSARLWHSPQVSCWPRFFCSVLNHVYSTIFQS